MSYQTRRKGQHEKGFYKKLNSVGKSDGKDKPKKVPAAKNRSYPVREFEFFRNQLNFRYYKVLIFFLIYLFQTIKYLNLFYLFFQAYQIS